MWPVEVIGRNQAEFDHVCGRTPRQNRLLGVDLQNLIIVNGLGKRLLDQVEGPFSFLARGHFVRIIAMSLIGWVRFGQRLPGVDIAGQMCNYSFR